MTLDGTRTFVLGSERPLVIDPGPSSQEHLQALERLLSGAAPEAILLTHGHSDHAGNAAVLAERTGAPILMGKAAPRLPFPDDLIGGWLDEGDVLECDAGPVEVHPTPGHAPEHLAFLHPFRGGGRALFAGDLFLGVGDTTLVSHPHGSVGDYLHSLQVVTRLGPTVVFPAHGPPIRYPERTVARYRRHRLDRIEEVRRLRETHPSWAAEEIADEVYGPDLDPRLRTPAMGSVEAILKFLAAAGDQR